MSGRDVRDLVCHHAGQLGFFVGRQNQPGIYVEESTRQSERIHFVGIDDLDGERYLGVGIPYQVLSDAVDVLRDHRILHHLYARLDLLGVLLAHANLGLQRIPVAHATAADLAVADGIHVILAAVVFDLTVVRLLDRRITLNGAGVGRGWFGIVGLRRVGLRRIRLRSGGLGSVGLRLVLGQRRRHNEGQQD